MQAGFYGYDANGDRVYKLTGMSDVTHLAEEKSDATVLLNNVVLYPNPYVTITPTGYTKHYYAHGERLGSAIGSGGWCFMSPDVLSEPQTQHELFLMGEWPKIYQDEYPFEYPNETIPDLTNNEDIYGNATVELQYACPMRHLLSLKVDFPTDILWEVMHDLCEERDSERDIFYRHSDHLGSANWITDQDGNAVQYLHYLPYGQLLANQQAASCDERYKFTGKERDAESGYDYFGARYYASPLYHWTKVDPLVDDYPWISPYAYCNWNPVKYVDPDGRDIYTINEETGTIEQVRTEGDNHSYYLTNGTSTSFVGSFQQNENGLVPLSGNVAFNNTSGKACGFSVKEGNESRSYISPNALASLIGAVGLLGYTDVAVIGFSLCNGASPSPSISHKNGNVGDLRYLRADGVSAPTLVKGNNFDFRRNEAMTAALSKFGWKDMISERVGGYLLPHTSAASERGIRTNHSNHLHIQSYHPSILETYMGINFTDIIVNGKR